MGVLNNRSYAVNINLIKFVGVGVLYGLILYAIGGNYGEYLKNVEVYRSSDGVWSFVDDMELCRFCPGNYNNLIFRITYRTPFPFFEYKHQGGGNIGVLKTVNIMIPQLTHGHQLQKCLYVVKEFVSGLG